MSSQHSKLTVNPDTSRPVAAERSFSPRLLEGGARKTAILHMGVGQAIAFGLSLVLARIYSPTDFGAYVVFANVFAFLNIATTLRFEQAILYVRSARRAATLVVLSLGVGVPVAALFFLVMLTVPAAAESATGASWFAALVFVSAWLSGAQRVVVMVLTRWKKYRSLARLNLARPTVIGLMQVAGGLLLPTGATLALGHSVAYLTLFLFALSQEWRIGKLLSFPGWRPVIAEAKKSRHFPLYNMTQNLLFVASEAIVPLAIFALHGMAAAGLYWFAARLTTAPMQVLVESLRPMIYRDLAARLGRRERITERIRKEAALLALPFVLAAGIAWVYGSPAISWIFGDQWRDAASLAAVLLVYSAVHAMAVPFIATLPLIRGQRAYLLVEILALMLRASGLLLFAANGPLAALASSCLSGAAIQIAFFIWVDRKVSSASNTAARRI